MIRTFSRKIDAGPVRVKGFTLIELMIALLLGLVVIGGVISVFLAGQRSYTTNKAISDVQDGSRIAFELMARDIRNAGLTGCNSNGRVANVLNSPSTRWWTDWSNAVHGYTGGQGDPATGSGFGTAAGTRVAGTDSLQILGAVDSGFSVASDAEPAAKFKLNESTSNLASGDIVIVCDPDHAVMVQISNYSAGTNVTFDHIAGSTVSPGNCSIGLGYPTNSDCTVNGNIYQFGKNSQVAKFDAADWYVGNNSVNGTSLYRVGLGTPDASGSIALGAAQEMVRDVTAMAIRYHESNSNLFVAADSVANWSTVDAVQVTLTLASTDKRAGSDGKAISRKFTATTTIRNRAL